MPLQDIFGTRTEALKKLFQVTKIDAQLKEALDDSSKLDDFTRLTQIKDVTQVAFKRPKERPELEDSRFSAEQKLAMEALLDPLNLRPVRTVAPQKFDFIIVMGGYEFRIPHRKGHFYECWIAGIRGDHLLISTGPRALDDNKDLDPSKALLKAKGIAAPTEIDMVKHQFSKAVIAEDFVTHKLDDVKEKAELLTLLSKAQCVSATAAPAGTVRPTTHDAALALVDVVPDGSKILVVTSEPHCGYQANTVSNVLSKCHVTVTGHRALPTTTYSEYLDSVMREIFEVHKRMEREHKLKSEALRTAQAKTPDTKEDGEKAKLLMMSKVGAASAIATLDTGAGSALSAAVDPKPAEKPKDTSDKATAAPSAITDSAVKFG